MTRQDYEAIDAVNFSTLKEFAKSAAHYAAALRVKKDATDAMDLGSAFHLLALEPEREGERLVVWEEGTRRGKSWDAFKEKHAGKLILKRDDYETAKAMAQSVHNSPQARKYLTGGRAEVTLQWEEAGFKLKGRVDYLGAAQVDLKATRSAAVEPFGRQMFDAKVHAQMAMYRTGIKAILPVVLIATDNTFPFLTQAYRVTEQQLEQGAAEYRAWLATLAHCRKTNQWPGYWESECDLKFPKWATEPEVYFE